MDLKFCPGCGEKNLKYLDRFSRWESPCTRYGNKSREQLISFFKDDLSDDELNEMLEWYNYESLTN